MRNVFIVCLVNAPVLMKSDLYPTNYIEKTAYSLSNVV